MNTQLLTSSSFGRNLRPAVHRLAAGLAAILGASSAAHAQSSDFAVPDAAPAAAGSPKEVQFSTSFMGDTDKQYDVSRFNKGQAVVAGDYDVDVFLNGAFHSRETVSFKGSSGGETAQACITAALLEKLGVDVSRLILDENSQECLDLTSLITEASLAYDSNQLRLDVSIPQIELRHKALGYVDPKLWNRGVTAFMLGYNANVFHNRDSEGHRLQSAYLGVTAGLNLGDWRFRNRSNYNLDGDGSSRFKSISTYAMRDIRPLKSQLFIGDTVTPGNFYDSIDFIGAQLVTDPRMNPDSMNVYAPIVRGHAETNAKVQIFQRDYLIYETSVAPGRFEIKDLYPNGEGGNLDVVITEADGRVRTFAVPYTPAPHLLRPGMSNYSLTMGKLHEVRSLSHAPRFAEATYQRGINNWLNAYAGVQATADKLYRSAQLGASFNTGIGAISMGVTGSRARISTEDEAHQGYSAELRFQHSLASTGTDLALSAYRFSSGGFLSLSSAALHEANTLPDHTFMNRRGELQLSVNHNFGERIGALFVNATRNRYWDDQERPDTSINAGWDGRIGKGSYGATFTRSRLRDGKSDNGISLSYNRSLGSPGRIASAPHLGVSASRSDTDSSLRADVGGSLGKNQQFSYTLGTRLDQSAGKDRSVSTSWSAPFADLGASYSRNGDARQTTLSASGALVVHAGGVTLAQRLGDTIGIVKAVGAHGARLGSDERVKVDRRGYMVTQNLSPYHRNEVWIDPKGASLDVEFDEASQKVVPSAGAVMLIEMTTKQGKAALIRALREDGSAVPFGARVADDAGNELGIVGQNGQVVVRTHGQDPSAAWHVEWGEQESCVLERPNPSKDSKGHKANLAMVEALCRG